MKITDYRSLFLNDTPMIDVRAPVEFHQGALPGAANFPILDDDERARVGTTYKEQGPAAAVELGHQMVSGVVKEARLLQWSQFIEQNPATVLYCFRGGQRSQITQRWLKETGVDRPLIHGGYKAVRQFLIEEIDRISLAESWLVVSGPTGSGKTQFVQSLLSERAGLDLEFLAKHRGSAFGAMDVPQPSQVDFENLLAVELIKLESRFSLRTSALVEDESRMIGSRYLPESLFQQMRASPVIWIDDPIETRVERILHEYVRLGLLKDASGVSTFGKFRKAVEAIHRRLGGLRTQEIVQDLTQAEMAFQKSGDLEPNRAWIQKLLNYYYDPLYLKSLERRQVHVAFRGTYQESQQFLRSSN